MRRLGLFLLLALLLALPARAAALTEEQAAAYGAAEVEAALPDEARALLDGAGLRDALDTEGLLSRLWDALRERAGGVWRRGLASAAALVAAALLCGLAGTLAEGEGARWVTLGGVLAVAAVAAGDAGAFIGLGAETLETVSAFSKALLPCLTAAATASGAVTSAAAKYAATALFMDLAITAAQRVLLPLVYAYMAAAAAAAALESPGLAAAAKLMKWLCGAATTVIMTGFTAYFSLTGAISGAADAAAAKAAKSAISAALPVVGGILSDAAGAVVAGAGLLRGAVGALGLFAVAAVCLTPFLTLGLQYLFYKGAAALAGGFADKRLGGLISDLGGAFGLVLGLVGAVAVMLFFSVISMVKAVGL